MIKVRKLYNGDDLSPKFIREIKAFLKGALSPKKLSRKEFEGKLSINFYYASGFIRNKLSGKWVYVSIPDIRFSSNWQNNILVRRAKDDRDYLGESNNFCTLKELPALIKKLTK